MLIFLQVTINNVGDFFQVFCSFQHIFRLTCKCKSIHWVRWETKLSFDGMLCQEYFYRKLSKVDNWFSSYSQKCRGCFFETQCRYGARWTLLQLTRYINYCLTYLLTNTRWLTFVRFSAYIYLRTCASKTTQPFWFTITMWQLLTQYCLQIIRLD